MGGANIILKVSIVIVIFAFLNQISAQSQGSSDVCSKFYRQLRRAGIQSHGRFDIPVDSEFPKFKLQVKFNRAIHSLQFRQMKAKDMGAHREFSIDMLEPTKNGVLQFNSVTRLRGLIGHTPRVTKIVYNGKTLCGGEISDSGFDSVVGEAATPIVRKRFGFLKSRA